MSIDSVFQAIAEPRRRAILSLIRGTEMSAGDIAAHFDVSGPAISQHLRHLTQAGLLAVRKDGTRRMYRVQPEALVAVRAYLAEFWDDQLLALKQAVEEETGPPEGRPE